MAYTQINVTIEAFSCVLLLILILSVLANRRRTRDNQLFLLVLVLYLFTTLGDMCAWIFDSRPGAAALLLAQSGNFMTYFCSPLAYIAFLGYIYAGISRNAKPRGAEAVLIGAILVLDLGFALLSVANLFTGVLYTIDSDNLFHWGPWSLLPNLLGVVQTVPFLLLLWRQRQYIPALDRWLFSCYILLPVAGLLAGMFFRDLMLAYPALAFALLVIYVQIQQAQDRRLVQQELELANARTDIMLSQIRPHFLYNALLGIKQLCDTEPKQASQALEHFAHYLRGNLYSISAPGLIPFETELEHVRDYLYLEKMRFEDRLAVRWETDFTDFLLPPLTLQPIVENAVRHGITKKEAGGTLTISSREAADTVVITIADDGAGFDPSAPPPEDRPHIGLENVRSRLEVQRGGRLQVESAPGRGATVTITLPKEAPYESDRSRRRATGAGKHTGPAAGGRARSGGRGLSAAGGGHGPAGERSGGHRPAEQRPPGALRSDEGPAGHRHGGYPRQDPQGHRRGSGQAGL